MNSRYVLNFVFIGLMVGVLGCNKGETSVSSASPKSSQVVVEEGLTAKYKQHQHQVDIIVARLGLIPQSEVPNTNWPSSVEL